MQPNRNSPVAKPNSTDIRDSADQTVRRKVNSDFRQKRIRRQAGFYYLRPHEEDCTTLASDYWPDPRGSLRLDVCFFWME